MGNNTSTIPDKNSFAALREHFADDYPVWTNAGFEIVKIHIDELFTLDPVKLFKVGERLVHGLSKDNMVFIRNSDKVQETVEKAASAAKEFLMLPEARKKQVATPEKSTFTGKREFYSGYSLIHFDNRDNKRDPEWRDVFQIRFSEDGHIPWPSDNFKNTSQNLYTMQWRLCLQALHAIALFLGINPEDVFSLIGWSKNSESLDPNPFKSVNTNLCHFHYFDKDNSYTTPQKCMVHQDSGLLTVLPKSDLPGLDLLHPGLEQWIPIEQFIDGNEMLLYCGQALSIVTNSQVMPATHRVVRQPQKERFSMPFEMKPDDKAVLHNLVAPEKDKEPFTYDDMSRQLMWAKICRQVNRADGLEPGSAEDTEWIKSKGVDNLVQTPPTSSA